MNNIKHGKFRSLSDFALKFFSLFKGPYGSCETINKLFQEKIRITVSFANDCSG